MTAALWFRPYIKHHMLVHNILPYQKKSHIGYIDMEFPQYVYSYADQEHSSMQNIFPIGCTDIASLLYKTLYDLFSWRLYYNGSIDVFPQVNVLIYWLNPFYLRRLSHNDCSYVVSPYTNHYMMAKITLPCKSFLILTTLIWFLPGVNPHMFIKSTFINKGFITITTFVCSLPSMNPHMLAKNTYKLYWYGLSPVWVLICLSILLFLANAFSHWLHMYGFSPVWVLICLSTLFFLAKVFSHWLHLYSFSPVWVLLW